MSTIKCLVFSGGGNKGLSFIGCLKALEEYNILEQVECFAGTSAGSIVSVLINLGYTSDELREILLNMDFSQLRDITSDGIFNYFQNFGFDTGDRMERVLRIFIRKKTDNEEITFSELYNLTGKKLVITGTCLNSHSRVFFNHLDHGDMKVIEALRISFSVPFVFNACKIGRDTYVDGCVADNYPLEAWDDPDEVLGFLLESEPSWEEISGLDDYAISIMQCIYQKFKRLYSLLYKDITVVISSNSKALNFAVTKEEKISLFEKGYEVTREYLQLHMSRCKSKKDDSPPTQALSDCDSSSLSELQLAESDKQSGHFDEKPTLTISQDNEEPVKSMTESLIDELSNDNKSEVDFTHIFDHSNPNKNI